MPPAIIVRAVIGAAAAAAFLSLAMLAGAPFLAAIAATAGGGAAAAFLLTRDQGANSPAKDIPDVGVSPALPGTSSILDAMDEPLLIVRDGRVLIANEAARSVLGQHIEGSDVRLAIRHPAAAERLARGRQEMDRDGAIELVGLGEQDRRWQMTTTTLEEQNILVRLSDRSDAHAAEQMRSDFVANASHELRTPLATLLGFLETLQDKQAAEDSKTRSRFLKIMFDEAKRMQHLVEDLMSLSRIEAERFSLPREIVDLLPLIHEARSNLRPLWEKKQMQLLVEEPVRPAIVAGDRSQLLQLIMNVVENAVRYGRAQSVVTIGLNENASDMVCLSVTDQGEGVPQEHLPHLTRRFYRVDAGRSRGEGGTGLGLAIVKHIVDRHRGRLDIRSKVGEGTIVQVFLPRAGESPTSLS